MKTNNHSKVEMKKPAPVKAEPEKKSELREALESQKTAPKLAAPSNKVLIPLLIVALLALGYYLFKDQLIVATVNGQPISRLALMTELEKQAGRQALDALITKTLVLQEASKQNVTVSEDEVNQEIDTIKANISQQGQDFDQILALQGLTAEDVKEQVRLQKLVEKMAGQNIEVTDEEVATYLDQNKDFLPKDADQEQLKNDAREQLRQQKLSQNVQDWITKLRNEAQINHNLFKQ